MSTGGGTPVFAEEQVAEFTLDPMIVTATRTEKRDVDVPASTEVFSNEKLKATGAENLADALKYVSGTAYKAYGPGGSGMGTMANEFAIRGIDNGTVILLNGSPISWRGKYNLEAIPLDNIERVEIVKTGGSVLYGSESMAGVVNIITKKAGFNSITVGYGGSKQQKYAVNVGDEKFGVNFNTYKYDKAKKVTDSSVNYTNLASGTATYAHHVEKDNFGIHYNFNERLTLAYNYAENKARYDRFLTNPVDAKGQKVVAGDAFNARTYNVKQHTTQLNYEDDKYKARLYFNEFKTQGYGPSYFSTSGKNQGILQNSYYNSKERNSSYGLDLQRDWKIGEKSNAILGFDYQKEKYDKSVYASGDEYSRNNFAFFAQWDQKFDDKNEFILGARETWTTGAYRDLNYDNFSGSAQYIHKLTDNQSVYVSVTQSFIMPTFAQITGNTDKQLPNPDLKPQKGINYELGWKKITDSHAWKVALYKINIKDNISATYKNKGTDNAEWQYANEDFKNYGIEISNEIKAKNGWSFNYGINYHDPKVKSSGKNASKTYWDRKFGRVQLNGGITYAKDKWASTLSGTYLCERVQTPSATKSYDAKPYFLTNFAATYKADKNNEFTLTAENLLNRRDIVTHSSSGYYSAPANFMLSYTYKF